MSVIVRVPVRDGISRSVPPAPPPPPGRFPPHSLAAPRPAHKTARTRPDTHVPHPQAGGHAAPAGPAAGSAGPRVAPPGPAPPPPPPSLPRSLPRCPGPSVPPPVPPAVSRASPAASSAALAGGESGAPAAAAPPGGRRSCSRGTEPEGQDGGLGQPGAGLRQLRPPWSRLE